MHRTNYESLHGASVAVRATQKGADVISIPELGLVYIPDGPDGPVDLGVTLPRVDSIDEAIEYAKQARRTISPAHLADARFQRSSRREGLQAP